LLARKDRRGFPRLLRWLAIGLRGPGFQVSTVPARYFPPDAAQRPASNGGHGFQASGLRSTPCSPSCETVPHRGTRKWAKVAISYANNSIGAWRSKREERAGLAGSFLLPDCHPT
jgi:hypothetical protein